jgi:iron complex outermembrane receptor protein
MVSREQFKGDSVSLRMQLAASAALVGILSVGATAQAAQSDATVDAAALNEVVVTGKHVEAPALVTVPGGTGLITADQIQGASVANLDDALKYVPGLFAQSASGGEATRLSIRGSGVTKGGFTWGNGVDVLFDGLPLSGALGTPYESFEPNAYERIEVYKGANAFQFGATQLGGAINLVQHTGYDSSPLAVRLEGGSYGYQREQISSGQVIGPLDYYVSATHFETGGYLYNSAATAGRLIGNVGYQLTPQLKTRFYFEDARQYEENISAQTLSQLLNAPRTNPYTGARVTMGSIFLANKTEYQIDDHSSLELGLAYKKPPLHNGNEPSRTFWNTNDLTGSLSYKRKDTVFGGHESDTTVSVLPSYVLPGSGAYTSNDATGLTTGFVKYGGSNTTVLAANDFQLTPKLWLATGIGWLYETRTNEIDNPVNPASGGLYSPAPAGVNASLNKQYTNYTPRVGLRYDITPQIEAYGNISQLVEAPQIISYAQSATFSEKINGVSYSNSYYAGFLTAPTTTSTGAAFTFNESNLKEQVGTNYEIGVKGQWDRFKWDVDYYNEQVHDELLTIYAELPNVDPKNPNGISYTENASPTVHEGVEASVDTELWKDDGNTVSLRQAFTWNNFHFAHENVAAGYGVLPGLPIDFYQGQLNYRHRSGLYAGLSVESSLAPYPVDYFNKTYAPSYTLVGANVGYAPPGKKWRIFVDAENLGDVHYASFSSATGLATASSAVFTAGEGRSVTGGLAFAF